MILTKFIIETLVLGFSMLLSKWNWFLCHWIVWIWSFIRVNELIEFNVVLEWHLLCLIEGRWWILEVKERPKLALLRLVLFAFVLSINLESSVPWTLSSLGHSWLDLFLLHRINLLIYSSLVLLLLILRVKILLLLLLLAKLPCMLKLVSTYLLKLLLEKHVVLLGNWLLAWWHISKLLIHMIYLLTVRSWLLRLRVHHLLLTFGSLITNIGILYHHVCTNLFLLFNLLLLSHFNRPLLSPQNVSSILLRWSLSRSILTVGSYKLVLIDE